MSLTWVLMTCLPPTKGHADIVKFAESLGNTHVRVLLCTQPDEPMTSERRGAVMDLTVSSYYTQILYYDSPIQQVPKDDKDTAFWQTWRRILQNKGFREGDTIVASDSYGKKLAEVMNAHFMPYDPDRSMRPGCATDVRKDPLKNFSYILPSFQGFLRKRITIFGAESCGKTTLANALATALDGIAIPEYARPYLEMVGSDITVAKMKSIHRGQKVLQKQATDLALDKPFIFQDTDLFSTLGYWHLWNDGPEDLSLMSDARSSKSDLYIVCPSNIPFEQDPLRYGGKVRESTDDYWINLCKNFDLNYKVLTTKSKKGRLEEATKLAVDLFNPSQLAYERVK